MQTTQPLKEDKDQNDLLLEVIHHSLPIKTHFELLHWLQGKVQPFLPHEILISAWGDYSLGLIYFDIVSSHPLLRTKNISENTLTPQILQLFKYWQEQGLSPQTLTFNNGLFNTPTLFKDLDNQNAFSNFNVHEMNAMLIHGIKDNRGSHDCLYILMSRTEIPASSKMMIGLFMPFIDCAFRRINQLENKDTEQDSDDFQNKILTAREADLMELLREGKTNREIATILDISAFTVKNHLQNIYKKLNAINRSQAVNRYTQRLQSTNN